jgi:hypothetical protein
MQEQVLQEIVRCLILWSALPLRSRTDFSEIDTLIAGKKLLLSRHNWEIGVPLVSLSIAFQRDVWGLVGTNETVCILLQMKDTFDNCNHSNDLGKMMAGNPSLPAIIFLHNSQSLTAAVFAWCP